MATTSFADAKKKRAPKDITKDVEVDGVDSKSNPEEADDGGSEEVARQTASDNLPARKQDAPAIGGVSGDIGGVNLNLPRIQIVQSTGELSTDFPPGSVVYDREVVIGAPPTKPTEWSPGAEMTLLSARLRYKENLDYDSDDIPEIVDSVEEVVERGGWLDWRKDNAGNRMPPSWIPVMSCLTLVRAPEGSEAEGLFTITDPEGRQCELGMWYLQKSAFQRAGKQIISACRFRLKNRETGEPELHKVLWTLQVRREKLGQYPVWVPKLRENRGHTPEYLEFLNDLAK